MSDLYNTLSVLRDPEVSLTDMESFRAQQMGDPRRAFNAGRIGTDVNDALVGLAEARAANDAAKAAELEARVSALRERQSLYAPRVGKIEDVKGVGDFIDYAQSAVGQAAASMMDPLAVSFAAQAAGRAASAIPTAPTQLAGKALTALGYVAPYLINRNQMIGEQYGRLSEDESLRARMSDQELLDQAETYGSLAAIPDSALPGLVGRQLSGAGFAAGREMAKQAAAGAAQKAAMGAGTKALMGMGVEGGTEWLQTKGAQVQHGMLNPQRDTSDDASEQLNAFVQGALGAGPFSTAGAMADAGYQRLGRGAEMTGAKAGEVIDLANEKAGPFVDKAKARAFDLFRRGKENVIDLASDEDGNISAEALTKNLKDITKKGLTDLEEGFKQRDEVERTIMGTPPDDLNIDDEAAFNQWYAESLPKRTTAVVDYLKKRGDEQAQALMTELSGARNEDGTFDPVKLEPVLDKAADLYAQDSTAYRVAQEIKGRSSFLQRMAKGAASAAATVGKAAGRAAMDIGKGVVDGLRDTPKRNLQTREGEQDSPTLRDFEAALDSGVNNAKRRGPGTQQDVVEHRWRNFIEDNFLDEAAKQRSLRRAEMASEFLRSQAGAAQSHLLAHRVEVDPTDLTGYLGDLGGMIGALTDEAVTMAESGTPNRARAGLEENVDRIARSLHGALGREKALEALDNMSLLMSDEKSSPVYDLLRTKVGEIGTKKDLAKQRRVQRETERALMEAIPQETKAQLMRNGVNLGTRTGRELLKDMVQAVGDGRATPEFRQALAKILGGEQTLVSMVDALSPVLQDPLDVMNSADGIVTAEQTEQGTGETDPSGLSDDAEAAPTEDWAEQQRAARRAEASGEKVYSFFGLQTLRNPDMQALFGYTNFPKNDRNYFNTDRLVDVERADKDPRAARPRLIPANDKERVEQAMARVRNTLGDEAGSWDVRFRPIAEILKELHVPEDGQLVLYRDYMLQQARRAMNPGKDTGRGADSVAARAAADEADRAHRFMRDMYARQQLLKNGGKDTLTLSTSPEERRAVWRNMKKFFTEHGVVEAGRMITRDPERISPSELQKMRNAGGEAMEAIRNLQRKIEDGTATPEQLAAAIHSNNLLFFQTADGKPMAVRANDLARVVAKNQKLLPGGEAEGGKALNNDERFLSNLWTGISMMLESPQVDGKTMPFMLSPDGKKQFQFGRTTAEATKAKENKIYETDTIPENLMLPSGKLYREYRYGKSKRGEKGEGTYEPDVLAAADANLDWYTPPVGEELAAGVDRSVEVDDIFKANRGLDRALGYEATQGLSSRAYPPGRMMERGPKIGQELTAALKSNFDKGFEQLKSWVRAGLQPRVAQGGLEYDARLDALMPKPGTTGVGGPHLLYPAAVALSREVVGTYDVSPEQIKALATLTNRLILAVAGKDVKPDQKVAILKALAGEKNAAKITVANVQKLLNARIAEMDQKAVMREAAQMLGLSTEKPLSKEELAVKQVRTEAMLQNAENWLKEQETTSPKPAAPERQISRMSEAARRVREKEEATKLGKSSAPQGGAKNQQTDAAAAQVTQEEMDKVRRYVDRVLGPKIKVEFADITGYAGEWIDATETIRISTTPAPGALQTAYHEALHAFFSKFVKNHPGALTVFDKLVNNPRVVRRLEALLADYPAALQQLQDGEERLVYIYQFWAAGLLDLPTQPKTLMQKIARFFRRVLGLIRDDERATAILESFHSGRFRDTTPSVAGQIIAEHLKEGMGTTRVLRKLDKLMYHVRNGALPSVSVLRDSDSAALRELADVLWTNPGEERADYTGYLNTRQQIAKRYSNLFAELIHDMDDRELADVITLLQKETPLEEIKHAPYRHAVGEIRALLQRFYRYVTEEAGMPLGDRGPDYFPRVWDAEALLNKKDEFVDMLVNNHGDVLLEGVRRSGGKMSQRGVAEALWQKIVNHQVVGDHIIPNRDDGVLNPFWASGRARMLDFITAEQAEPFLSKNLVRTMTTYFHNGARAAEYHRRFNRVDSNGAVEYGVVLDEIYKKAEKELMEAAALRMSKGEFDSAEQAKAWAQRQLESAKLAVGGIEGVLGKNISDTWRKVGTWATVYQNIRLLPLALFASVVDPLGLVVRGATMKEAYETFLRGVGEVVRTWGDMFRDEPAARVTDKWTRLAEAVGAVEAEILAHHVSDEYSSLYMDRKAKAVNDVFFKLNGMEAWNRGMRIGATRSAVQFIERHVKQPTKDSERYLKELGLAAAEVKFKPDGTLATTKQELMAQGMSKADAEEYIGKLYRAINSWVEGAILAPNAAQRPAYFNDPHYSMFFHLKQFTYNFHTVVLKRAVREAGYGNLQPLGALFWYVPVMIGADIMKGLIQGGGELPAHMKGMDVGDWVVRGVERAGLLGIGQIGFDATGEPTMLAGPMVEQIVDAFQQPLEKTVVTALPAQPLYREALL